MNPDPQKIQCPYCGTEKIVDIGVLAKLGTADMLRGIRAQIQKTVQQIKTFFSDVELDEANARLDLKCTKCQNTFHYDIQRKESSQ